MAKVCVASICLFLFLNLAYAKIGFKKDQSLEIADFPPKLGKAQDGIPLGHLRPIGYQRKPEGKVNAVKETVSPQVFYEGFIKDKKPLIFEGLVKDAPASSNWDDTYLKEHYGELNIHVVVKKELLNQGPKVMKFKKFLKEYQYEDWYLSNTVPQEMMHELMVPSVLDCGLDNQLMESEIWMSSGGTSSLLHSHADHNIHCLFSGRKDFTIIRPNFKAVFDWKHGVHPGSGHSEIDTDMINVFQYRDIAQVPWLWAKLKPGDCIFIPAGVVHHVRSWGRSISNTIHFAPSPQENYTDCKKSSPESLSLDQANFMWTYTHGDKELSNIKLNGKSLRHHLLLLMRNEPVLSFELFKDFYEEVMSEIPGHHPKVEDVWKNLDPDSKTKLTRSEIETMPLSQLNLVAPTLNYPHTHEAKKIRDEL